MSVVKITLNDELTNALKKSIFKAIHQSGIYQADNEMFKEGDISELDCFDFQSVAENYQFELQFISDGKCLKISSDSLDNQNKCIEFENNIKNILADSRIKTLVEKKITLDKLTVVLHQFKNTINARSNRHRLIAGIITIVSLATGFRGIEIFNISASLLILVAGLVLGFISFGWMFRDSKEVNKQILSDPQKEAKRIFDKLKDY